MAAFPCAVYYKFTGQGQRVFMRGVITGRKPVKMMSVSYKSFLLK